MAQKKIAVDLFYDVISPYTMFAFEQLTGYSKSWSSMSLRLKPFLLGAVMKAAQNRPPGMVPNKMNYMMKDLERLNGYLNVPLKIPSNFVEIAFEKGSLKAMRFLTSVEVTTDGKQTEAVSRAMFRRIFTNDPGKDVTQTESFQEAGLEAGLPKTLLEEIMQKMDSPVVKGRLRENTDEAIGYNAFGSPTIVAHMPDGPELYFGSDRIELLAVLLGEKYHGPARPKL